MLTKYRPFDPSPHPATSERAPAGATPYTRGLKDAERSGANSSGRGEGVKVRNVAKSCNSFYVFLVVDYDYDLKGVFTSIVLRCRALYMSTSCL